MSITHSMVLPPDVMLLPATQLPPHIRGQIDLAVGDYAILRPGTRSYSKVVDAQFAELVAQFREPRTIVEAVVRYSWPRQIDPEQVLDSAFDLLQHLMNSRLLVPADSEDARRIAPSFQPGAAINEFVVRHAIQVLDDSELYQVEASDGRLGALKITRGGKERQQTWLIDRELAILQHLDGRVNPQLLGAGDYAGRRFLVTEWLEGKNASLAASALRPSPDAAGRQELLRLCCAVTEAYAQLHEQGIVHGDVHPRNVLVSNSGLVRIIDYGFSRMHNADGPLGFAVRGGVSFFFEPEYARACIDGAPPPLTSFAGEQYSVAAMLYALFTGADYAGFSYEQARLLRQVIDDTPLPFYKRGAKPWPEVEDVLQKALSKEPLERFASLSDLSDALRQASAPVGAVSTAAGPDSSAGQALLGEVLRRLDLSSSFFTTGVTNAPSCSITYGASGIAYALYRMAMARQEPRLLSLADLWCQRALRTMNEETAFYHSRYDVSPETVGRISPYHTASGIFCVQVLIAHALGDRVTHQRAMVAFVTASEASCNNLDLTLGRSGTLLACSLLLDIAPPGEAGAHSLVRDLGDRTVRGIWERINALGPIQQQQEIDYLGIAHGWAGILYATLRWHRASGSALPAGIPDRLRQLVAYAEPWGHGVRWPAILDKQVYMPGWCNGSAGFVYLWTAAHQVLDDPSYLHLAEQAAWNVWEGPDTLPTLCCGLAGRSYALLKLYKHTGDATWLSRAEELAERAAGVVSSNPDLVNSLYKGEVGVAALIADLADPGGACMPFFEGEGWRMD